MNSAKVCLILLAVASCHPQDGSTDAASAPGATSASRFHGECTADQLAEGHAAEPVARVEWRNDLTATDAAGLNAQIDAEDGATAIRSPRYRVTDEAVPDASPDVSDPVALLPNEHRDTERDTAVTEYLKAKADLLKATYSPAEQARILAERKAELLEP